MSWALYCWTMPQIDDFSALNSAAAQKSGYLGGHLIIAMPQMTDPRFQKSVIYLCAHTKDAAMGLVVNKPLDNLTLPDLLGHLEIPCDDRVPPQKIHFGGPVETARGFVLHSTDYVEAQTLAIGHDLALTATLDILRAIGKGAGPRRYLIALGYAGWGAGQFESEIQANAWLHGPMNESVIFDTPNGEKWQKAIGLLGISPLMLSTEAGHG